MFHQVAADTRVMWADDRVSGGYHFGYAISIPLTILSARGKHFDLDFPSAPV